MNFVFAENLFINSSLRSTCNYVLFSIRVYFESESRNLIDEESHLIIFDRTRAILVGLFRTFVEVLFIELVLVVSISHLFKVVSDELLGLHLVESTRIIFVVGAPDLLNDFCDDGNNVTDVYDFCFFWLLGYRLFVNSKMKPQKSIITS